MQLVQGETMAAHSNSRATPISPSSTSPQHYAMNPRSRGQDVTFGGVNHFEARSRSSRKGTSAMGKPAIFSRALHRMNQNIDTADGVGTQVATDRSRAGSTEHRFSSQLHRPSGLRQHEAHGAAGRLEDQY